MTVLTRTHAPVCQGKMYLDQEQNEFVCSQCKHREWAGDITQAWIDQAVRTEDVSENRLAAIIKP